MVAVALFYMFSLLVLIAGLGVILMRNPVYSVLCLIFGFFNAAGLFVLLGAEFLAMLLVIVYVGAVAVLFLFVVMMLNIHVTQLKEGFLRYLPAGAFVAVVLFVELFFLINVSIKTIESDDAVRQATGYTQQEVIAKPEISNTEAIGQLLYNKYALIFEISGLILLVAMIGAIVLTHRQRSGVRKQDISSQVARDPKDCIELVKVKSGSGIQ